MYKNIANPTTGNKVSINSKEGKQIINNYMNLLGNYDDVADPQESTTDKNNHQSVPEGGGNNLHGQRYAPPARNSNLGKEYFDELKERSIILLNFLLLF